MEGLDAQVDETVRTSILENCGRNCISRTFIDKAKSIKKRSKDINDFLEKLSHEWKHLHLEKGNIYVVYEKCYCPMVRDYRDKLSPSFCNCSRGWIKELFESVLEKPVEVKLKKSIVRGDGDCEFRVYL